MKKHLFYTMMASALAMGLAGSASAEVGPTVKAIQERGEFRCTGNNGSQLGFAELDDKGAWKGFDIDFCRAMSTMILGSDEKMTIVPISWAQRFPALQSGEVDIVIKVTGWTMSRDTDLGVQFSNPYMLGTTQFLTKKELGVTEAKELDGATLCIRAGTSSERITADYLQSLGVKYEIIQFEKLEELNAAYFAGRCEVMPGFGPNLAVTQAQAANPADHVLLNDVMAVEPESMAMRQGDDNFVDVANWLITALQLAEQYNITAANVDEIRANPTNPVVATLLGVTPGIGDRLGLSNDWAYNVIKKVGNYGEIFDRNLTKPFNYPRGINHLITDGGALVPLVLD